MLFVYLGINGLKQQVNIPDEMFIKLSEVETFYEIIIIYKNNEQPKLTDYFDLNEVFN